ncbi:hypothetical protein PHACT_06520 [Pseudohongiella acticola]|jgi:hypothetical protein|uniref:Uncharacterized protein n=1 Tax=Pseudohongiella acticola TaxID=1524254 RepID=A0A1E8CKA9_9GAMM|nr:hypothetical protein [Pseudohongiella acticola]OFE12833.1 hypothetical protein PHACT_06520 [Pseudohongiella acticola]
MSESNQSKSTPNAEEREYEKSGLYPENEKPFRILALLGWLGVVVICLAGAAAVLDFVLL